MSNINMFEDSVLLDITFHKAGIRRKANKDNIETAADKDMLGLSKAIIDSTEYEAVLTVARNCRKWLEQRSGESILKRGTYQIKVAVLEEVYAYVEQAIANYNAAVENFLAVYPARKAEAETRLGPSQYVESDYPDVQKLRSAFFVTKRLLDVSPPGSDKVAAALRAKELVQWRADMAQAAEETRLTLRKAARDLIAGLRERMDKIGTLDDKGHKIKFNKSALEKVQDFLDLFYHRDLTNDTEMQTICAAAKEVLSGVDADTLRDNDAVRIEVETETGKLVSQLDNLLEATPARAFFLDEAEDDTASGAAVESEEPAGELATV